MPPNFDFCSSKYGQPLDYVDSNPILHSFFLSTCQATTAGVRLNLGAGGDGVVGRTVSIVDSREMVLGEGVIGWI
jgi:hypothetical protein